MSNIINKSNHPVEIKKIDILIWSLRDEIEAAISKRLNEFPDTPSNEIDISDIKDFYNRQYNQKQNQDEEDDSNLDASGNPLDDDAMAMMAALGGDGEDSTEADEEKKAESEDDTEEVASPEEAQDTESSNEEEDDEAAAMAAAMLADQGGSDDAVVASETQTKEFKRVRPPKDKIRKGFIFLADVHMEQIMFFAKSDFMHGQSIVIEFLLPNSFMQIAEVKKTMHITRNSKVISPHKPSHRIQAKFLFRFENERISLRNFLKSIEPHIPVSPKKLKKPGGDDEDDDDDFDGLGL